MKQRAVAAKLQRSPSMFGSLNGSMLQRRSTINSLQSRPLFAQLAVQAYQNSERLDDEQRLAIVEYAKSFVFKHVNEWP